MNEKFNKDAKVEQLTKILGRASVLSLYKCTFTIILKWNTVARIIIVCGIISLFLGFVQVSDTKLCAYAKMCKNMFFMGPLIRFTGIIHIILLSQTNIIRGAFGKR